MKVQLLASAGKLDEASAIAKTMLADCTELYDKQEISGAIAKAYADAGRTQAADLASQIDLPQIPNISFTTMDGFSSSLEALRGKVVVIDCWFISCPGCNMEKQALNRLVDSFNGDTNVVFLSIATDGRKALEQFFAHTPSKFKTVASGYSLCEQMGVSGFPTHVIIDPTGRTVSMAMGGGEHVDDELRPIIQKAAKKS